jgi:hypothetical protein
MASSPAAYLHFGEFDSYGKLDFDKKAIRKGMRLVGALVRREARALVNKHEPSAGGEYPARAAGLLYRSIRAKVSRPGFLVKIAPQKIAGMKDFYPAYLHYGVKQGGRLKSLNPDKIKGRGRRGRGVRAAALAARAAGAWKLEPRKNFMADALESSTDRVQQILRQAFADSLK